MTGVLDQGRISFRDPGRRFTRMAVGMKFPGQIRKGFHSIIFAAISRGRMTFIMISMKFPGYYSHGRLS